MDLIIILENFASQDSNEASKFQSVLESTIEQTNMQEFMVTLSEIACHQTNSPVARKGAAMQLTKLLTSDRIGVQIECRRRWFSFHQDVRTTIKNNLIASLGTEKLRPSELAHTICAIANSELPRGKWPDLMDILVFNVTQAVSLPLKEASMETISLICQAIRGKLLKPKANAICQAILHGMKSEESMFLKSTATGTLFHAMKLISSIFEREVNRHLIMQLICEGTQAKDVELKVASLKCLAKAVSCYYNYIEHYMGRALFSISVEAMKSGVVDVKLEGIKFWSNICKKEEQLLVRRSELEQNQNEISVCRFYAMGALQYLGPILYDMLVTQDINNCEGKLSPFSAAESCLKQLVACCKDKITFLVDHVKGQLKNPEWRHRNAAVICFGAIFSGMNYDNSQQLVEEIFPILIEIFVNDPHPQVKGSAALAISELSEYLPELPDPCMTSLLEVFMQGLNAEPKVASKVCKAIEKLAANILEETEKCDEEPKFFEPLIEKLLELAIRVDFLTLGLYCDAFLALNELIDITSQECYGTIVKTMLTVIAQVRRVLDLEDQIQTEEDEKRYNGLLMQLLITCQAALNKLHVEDITGVMDSFMACMLQILNSSKCYASKDLQAEAFNAISTLHNSIKDKFLKYVDAFLPVLLTTLKCRDATILTAAVNVTNEIVCSMPQVILPYHEEIVHDLLEHLMSNNTSPLFKPDILSTIGEISLIIGPNAKKYVDSIFIALLQQLSQIEDDYDILKCNNFMEQYLYKICRNVTDAEIQPVIQSHFSILESLMVQASKIISICETTKLDESDFEKLISTFADSVQIVLSSKQNNQILFEDITEVIKNSTDLVLN